MTTVNVLLTLAGNLGGDFLTAGVIVVLGVSGSGVVWDIVGG